MIFWIAGIGLRKQLGRAWLNNVSSWLSRLGRVSTSLWQGEGAFLGSVTTGNSDSELQADFGELKFVLEGWIRFNSGPVLTGEMLLTSAKSDMVRGLDEYPQKVLSESLGEFSFVRVKSDTEMIVGTDAYGIHPVYFYISEGARLCLASNDLRSLFFSETVPFEVNQSTVADRLGIMDFSTLRILSGETYFKDIRTLKGGSYARLFGGKLEERKYWDIRNLKGGFYGKHAVNESYRYALNQAVRDRIDAGARMITLSGGIDSATVAAAAIDCGSTAEIVAVHSSYRNPENKLEDDSLYAKDVMRRLNLRGILIYSDDHNEIANLKVGNEPIYTIDEPVACISRRRGTIAYFSSRYGSKYAMTGFAADAFYDGNETAVESLLRRRMFAEAWRFAKKGAGGGVIASMGFITYFGFVLLMPASAGKRLVDDCSFPDITKMPLGFYFTDSHKKREMKVRHLFCETMTDSQFLGDYYLRYMYHRAWPKRMIWQQDVCPESHPYLDRRVIETAFRIPPEMHYDPEKGIISHYGGEKQVQRKAYWNLLPEAVRDRIRKTTYGLQTKRQISLASRELLTLFMPPNRIILADLGIINPDEFLEELAAAIIASEDPNLPISFGFGYEAFNRVIQTEIWLREMSCGRKDVLERARPRNDSIWLANDIEMFP